RRRASEGQDDAAGGVQARAQRDRGQDRAQRRATASAATVEEVGGATLARVEPAASPAATTVGLGRGPRGAGAVQVRQGGAATPPAGARGAAQPVLAAGVAAVPPVGLGPLQAAHAATTAAPGGHDDDGAVPGQRAGAAPTTGVGRAEAGAGAAAATG